MGSPIFRLQLKERLAKIEIVHLIALNYFDPAGLLIQAHNVFGPVSKITEVYDCPLGNVQWKCNHFRKYLASPAYKVMAHNFFDSDDYEQTFPMLVALSIAKNKY